MCTWVYDMCNHISGYLIVYILQTFTAIRVEKGQQLVIYLVDQEQRRAFEQNRMELCLCLCFLFNRFLRPNILDKQIHMCMIKDLLSFTISKVCRHLYFAPLIFFSFS